MCQVRRVVRLEDAIFYVPLRLNDKGANSFLSPEFEYFAGRWE